MAKFGLFRGETLAGNVVFKDINQAIKERNKWNKDFEEFRKSTGKEMKDVEVKEIKTTKVSAEQKLREMFG